MDRFGGNPLPDHVLDSIRRNRVAIKGPDHDPGRQRFPVGQRRPAQGARPVRPGAPLQDLPGRAHALRRHARRPRDRAREHRGPVRRDRVRARLAGAREVADAIEQRPAVRAFARTPASRSSRSRSIGTRRVVQFAFDYAREHGRKKVTAVHKANIMKYTDGLWLEVAARGGGGVSATSSSRTGSSTTCACSWCRSPSCTTCWCCPTSTATSCPTSAPGWSAGWASPRAPTSARTPRCSSRPTARAPKYAGQNKVNPMAMMLSGVLMLQHLERARRGRPAGGGDRRGDRRGQQRHLRHEAAPRSDRRLRSARLRWPTQSSSSWGKWHEAREDHRRRRRVTSARPPRSGWPSATTPTWCWSTSSRGCRRARRSI